MRYKETVMNVMNFTKLKDPSLHILHIFTSFRYIYFSNKLCLSISALSHSTPPCVPFYPTLFAPSQNFEQNFIQIVAGQFIREQLQKIIEKGATKTNTIPKKLRLCLEILKL